MAKHEITLHENTSATKTVAPYLGKYVTKSTRLLADIVAKAAPKAGMPAIKLQTLIENDIEAFTALEKAGACRIHVDGGYVELRVLGSFLATDSTWNSERNKLVIVFAVNPAVRDALVNETGTIVTDATSTKVRLDNVFDVASPKPTEIVYGKRPFKAQGVNLVMDDEDAKAVLVNDLGVNFDCDVVETPNRQNVILQSQDLLEAGDYKLVVFSRGGDPEGQLQSDFRRVKYLRVADPTELDLHMYSLGDGDAKVWTTTPEGFAGNATTTGGTMIGTITCDEDPSFKIEDAEFDYDDDPSYPNPTYHYVASGGTFESGKTYHATFNRRAGKEAEYTPASKSVELVIV